jgi:molybdopterin/thiamine biosynthesis adenylyltransferase
MNGDKLYQRWFEKHPDLFAKQTDILKSAGFELDETVSKEQGRIQFVGYLKVDPSRQLFVVFPQAFPSSAPKMFDTKMSKLLSRHHRGDNRQLCLFGFNENRWSATLSVAEALKEAEMLITNYKDENALEQTTHPPEPITRAIPYSPGAAVLVPPPISDFNDFGQIKSAKGTFSGRIILQGNSKLETRGRGLILKSKFGEKVVSCSAPYTDYIGNQGKEFFGDWYYLKEPLKQASLREVINQCFQQSQSFSQRAFHWLALIFHEEVGMNSQTKLTWLIVRAYANGQCHIVRTFPYIQQERYVRIPGLEGLNEKRVALIGCGSLGSKIAANLAASGVNRFRLVDYDYYEPNNSVRHELGVEFFGFNKEYALLQRLCSLNPAVVGNSKFLNFQVAGVNPFAAEEQLYSLLKDSDIIIDTTGIHSVTHFLNEISFELEIPLLVASVTNGAWGGDIVRVVPGKTPCYVCWLDQYYDHKPPSAPLVAGEIFAPGCDQPTFTGTTYDLGIVAGLATSMCVETLLPEIEHADFTKNYIRWSGKDENGKPSFLTDILSTTAHQECWRCGS